jgi:hypothetical protein
LEEGVANGESEEGGEAVAACEDGYAEDSYGGLVDSEGVGVDVGCWEHEESIASCQSTRLSWSPVLASSCRIHTLPISLSTTPRPSTSNTKSRHLGLREDRPDSDSSGLATALALPVSSTHSPRMTLLLTSCSCSCHSCCAPPLGFYSAALMRWCGVLRLAPLACVWCRLYSSSGRNSSLAIYPMRSSNAQTKRAVLAFRSRVRSSRVVSCRRKWACPRPRRRSRTTTVSVAVAEYVQYNASKTRSQ